RAVKVRAQMLIGLAVVVVFAYRWLTTGHAQWDTIAHIALDVVSTGLAVSATVELFYTLFTPSLDEALDPLILGVSAFALAKLSGFRELTTAVATPILLLAVAIGVLFLARRLLPPNTEHHTADAVPADQYPIEDAFPEPRRTGPVDRAAIFGAALAAVIVLAVVQGPWTPLGTVIGAVLLLVIAGFYAPRGASLREALAVGAVV